MKPEFDVVVVYEDPEITIDFRRHEVVVRGERVDLSATEFRLLQILTQHANGEWSLPKTKVGFSLGLPTTD